MSAAQLAAELGLGAQVAAAELKLTAALPSPYRDASMRIRQRFHLDTRGCHREPDAVLHLLAVAEAPRQDQTIEVRYRHWAPGPARSPGGCTRWDSCSRPGFGT